MRDPRLTLLAASAVLAFGVFTGAIAEALIIANGPDDICAPTDDPCIVDDKIQIQAPGILDFGLRTLRIVAGGRLEQTADVRCGAFEAVPGTSSVAVDSNNGAGDAGTFTLTALRACSGDATTPCLDDSLCAGMSLGTCSVGSGTIDVAAKLNGKGGPGATMTLRAAGDIVIDGAVNLNSTTAGEPGGTLKIESFSGSVILSAAVRASGGNPTDYLSEPDRGGELNVTGAMDVEIRGDIDLAGGANGGYFEILADRDVMVSENVNVNAGKLFYAYGGIISLTAGRDVHVQAPENTTRLSSNGAQALYKTPYGGVYSGDGGYTFFIAGEDVIIDEKVIVESRSGTGGYDSQPYGGKITVSALATATVDGVFISEGRGGVVPEGGEVLIEAGSGITLGASSHLDINSKRGGAVRIVGDGPVVLNGRIDVRGGPTPKYIYGQYPFDSYGGLFSLEGAADVTVGGVIENGANGGSTDDIEIDVCRLTIAAGGSIDHTHGGGDFNSSNLLRIGESMTVEPGGSLLANGQLGQINQVRYRDANKPPALDGDVDPPATLIVDPSLDGCPVCGNLEIDQGESCDDGGTVSGDGCRDDCQDEGCVAETPGFPGVPICDDADACTVDVCDPVAHTCNNIASCEEGIACTTDACVLGACEHTPVDSLCDDGNECTDDLCSATSGCLYVDLTGRVCDDGDLCTLASTCASGDCVPDSSTPVNKARIRVKLRDGDADRLKVKGDLPLPFITTQPTLTGMLVQLQDAQDVPLIVGTIPNSEFEDVRGDGLRFRFRDKDGSVASASGIQTISMKLVPGKAVAKFKLKGGSMDLEGALDQTVLSVSVLLGTDPALDDCVTARRISCATKGTTSVACKN